MTDSANVGDVVDAVVAAAVVDLCPYRCYRLRTKYLLLQCRFHFFIHTSLKSYS